MAQNLSDAQQHFPHQLKKEMRSELGKMELEILQQAALGTYFPNLPEAMKHATSETSFLADPKEVNLSCAVLIAQELKMTAKD